MKISIFLLLFFSFLVISAQETTIDKFADDVFTAITKNNYQAFDIFTVKKEDYNELNQKQNFKDENARKNALNNAENILKNHQLSMKEKFEKVQKNAKNAGIQWTDCKYLGYRIINKVPLKNGFKYDIAIQFSYKNLSDYEIYLNDCYQIKKGWIIWKAIGGPW